MTTPWRNRYRPIVEAAAIKHGYDVDDLVWPATSRKMSVARQEAIFGIWSKFGPTFPFLGRMFHCDHTSIIYAVGAHMHRHNIEGKYCAFYLKRVERYKTPARRIESGDRKSRSAADRPVNARASERFGARGVFAP